MCGNPWLSPTHWVDSFHWLDVLETATSLRLLSFLGNWQSLTDVQVKGMGLIMTQKLVLDYLHSINTCFKYVTRSPVYLNL